MPRLAGRALGFIVLAAFFICGAEIASAQTPLHISRQISSYALLPNYCDAAPDAADVAAASRERFVPYRNFRQTGWPITLWLRCQVSTPPPSGDRWLIVLDAQVTRAELYTPSILGYQQAVSGMSVPYADRTDKYYFPGFALQTFDRPFYLHLRYFPDSPLSIRLRTEHFLIGRVEPYRIVEGLFFGALLAVALFNLYVFIALRDRPAGNYVFYIAALMLNELVATGLGSTYLWPHTSFDLRWSLFVTLVASFGAFLLFARAFLQTRQFVPVLDAVLIGAFGLVVVTGFLPTAFAWASATLTFGLLAQIGAIILTAAIGIVRWRQGFLPARFFVIGFVPGMIGVSANLAYNVFYPYLPHGNWFLAENGVEFGTIFQSIIMSFALIDRIRVLDRAHADAKAELVALEAEAGRLHELALHDPLTGLANRMLFTEELGRALLRARRKGTLVGVMFADLDGFKPINDIYGHRVGDQLLREVGRRFGAALRQADLTARLGGDEFAIIVEELQSAEHAQAICRSLSGLLDEPVVLDGMAVPIGISVGCSIFPADGGSVDQLLHAADLRMYAQKQEHKASI